MCLVQIFITLMKCSGFLECGFYYINKPIFITLLHVKYMYINVREKISQRDELNLHSIP